MRRVLLLLVALSSLALGAAQGTATPQASGAPTTIADRAVRTWLERPALDPLSLSSESPAEICQQLPDLLTNPPPPEGTRVNFDDRRAAEEGAQTRRYTYPVAFPNGRLEVLEVRLTRQGQNWQAERVGLDQTSQTTPSIPDLFQSPVAAIGFVFFSLLLVYGLIRPSLFRRWLAEGWGYIKEHRRLTIGTIVFLYGLFGIGLWGGSSLPPACETFILTVVSEGVDQLGATAAYESGNVPRAAVVTFYQNFVMGAFATTFVPAALTFGLFAYLLNGVRFLTLGLPFGFAIEPDPVTLITVAILIIVELLAYVLVTAGGGMLLVTLIRGGFRSLGLAFRKLTMMLPLAFLLLMIGAWYEAAIIILPQLLGGN
jgi:hypothetical protein